MLKLQQNLLPKKKKKTYKTNVVVNEIVNFKT